MKLERKIMHVVRVFAWFLAVVALAAHLGSRSSPTRSAPSMRTGRRRDFPYGKGRA